MNVRVAGTPSAAAVAAALRKAPRLRDAIESISTRAGIPEPVLRAHLDASVVQALERLGARYLREMGDAIEQVSQLRRAVHDYYERAFAGQLDTPGLAKLAEALDLLKDRTRELVTPQEWAARQRRQGRPAPDPMTNLNRFSVNENRPPGRPAMRLPAGDPAAAPRWATRRFERRIAALPTQLRTAMLRARTLQESTVDAVLRGEHSAEALLDDLRHVLGPADLTRARTAIEILRDPGLPYALGGGLRGGARPNAAISTMYQALPRTQRSALERAAAADPEFVRAMVHGEHAQGTVRDQPVPWRAEEMDRFLADSGFPAQQRADLENALIRVNRVHRGQRADIEAGAGTGRDARSRAAALDDQAAALGLPERGRIVTALRRSPLLRDLATRNPAQLVDLASDWLVNAARRAEQGRPPEPLDVYVRDRIMTTQIRGMSGELNAVFQLADDLWVLKAPDIRVTDPGTDFIVLHPRTGEIWLSDNKTLSQHGLGEVSSLIQNLGRNLESDVEGLAEAVAGLRDTALPARDLTAVRGALTRLRQARDRVDEVVGRLSREQIDDPRVQARVARILDELRIRRVITNAGGELTHLQARLQQMKVDLADLRAVDFDAGMRPLRKRKRRR